MRRQRNLIGPQAMGGLVSLWGQSSLIKSIQRGTINVADNASSNTGTITSVDLANAVIIYGYYSSNVQAFGQFSNYHYIFTGAVALTNATTVTASISGSSGASETRTIAYEVIEYVPGVIKSLQSIATNVTTPSTSTTTTIVAVNTSKSFYLCSGCRAFATQTATPGGVSTRGAISSSTGVTATLGLAGNSNDITLNGIVVEFY